ncbi:uncharacterized protein LOC127838133 [Dreissena polymorpha]|uniref:Uncharacterized protein n=1 Tax=Dreissena polymorpha TaxID=45954 RepID=A0A9D4F432_DREPO|nr:uncharacterized protein LOC127838133 [Dreissena polymorpha]KAH3791468.1 hypothetical protein DPMN_144954 [Dreissena polymorpha]
MAGFVDSRELDSTKYPSTNSGRSSRANFSGDSIISVLYCVKHDGKLVQSYCKQHKDVCCSMCVAVSHGECVKYGENGVVTIETVAKDVVTSDELKKVRENVDSVLKDVDKIKTQRQQNLAFLSATKNSIYTEISEYTARLKAKIDEIDKRTQAHLGEVYVKSAGAVEQDIQLCDAVSDSLRALPTLLSGERTEAEVELFIQMKKAEKRLSEGRTILETVGSRVNAEVLNFQIDRTYENDLLSRDSLGRFKLAQRTYTATPLKELKIGSKFDTGLNHNVVGLTQLPDGKLVTLHGIDRKLKVLDACCKVLDQADLSAKPFGICYYEGSDVIISLNSKNLQFVTISGSTGKAKPWKMIKVGIECYGLAARAGEIFVACGGGSVYEAKAQLRVYNTTGVLIRLIERGTDTKPIFSSPRYLALSQDGNTVYISDLDRGVVTFDVKKSVISGFWSRRLKSPRGISVDADGNVVVVGNQSNNVIQFNRDGKIVSTLLSEADGILGPLAMYIADGKMMLTFDKSQSIHVYALC